MDGPPRYAPIEIYELFVTHLPGKAGTKYAVRGIEIERAGHDSDYPCLPETELDFLGPHLDLPLDLKPDFEPDLELLDLAVFNPAALFRDLKPLHVANCLRGFGDSGLRRFSKADGRCSY